MFEQNRVIMRLQQRVNQETNILVCFLSGSHGRRKNDDYSDLDVALVYANSEKRETAWKNRSHFIQSVLPYLSAKSFDADHIQPYFHIALYSNGTKVDYRFETLSSLIPNPWDRDIHILKDSDKWAEEFQEASAQASLTRPLITVEELTQLDNRFWVMFWDVFRLLLRGDYNKPFTIYLELLHFTLPTLLRLLPPEDQAYEGLLQASFSHDTKATAQHLGRLLGAYQEARSSIIRRLNLTFTPNHVYESAIEHLVKRLV